MASARVAGAIALSLHDPEVFGAMLFRSGSTIGIPRGGPTVSIARCALGLLFRLAEHVIVQVVCQFHHGRPHWYLVVENAACRGVELTRHF